MVDHITPNAHKTWTSGHLRMDGNVLVEEDHCITDGERRITGKWSLTPVQTEGFQFTEDHFAEWQEEQKRTHEEPQT